MSLAHLAVAAPGIEGRWRVVDAGTGKPHAIVEVKRQGAAVTGRIVEFFPLPGEPSDPLCEACRGVEKGRRIRGLDILTLSGEGAAGPWRGQVLDPDEGQRYQCTATLVEGGRALELRGYVWLPVFGRTERWSRVD